MAEIDPDARFKKLKLEAKQESTASTQAKKEALNRRFAQSGLLSSGAAIKQENIADKQGQSALSRRLSDIETSQEDSALRRQEIEKGRQFQTSEREAGQSFGSSQADKQRGFISGERQAGQKFAGEQAGISRKFAGDQADLQRGFLTGEREAGQEFGAGQAGLQREFITGEREAGQTFASDQAGEQREFITGERQAGQTFRTGEREAGQEFASSENKLGRDQQEKLLEKQQIFASEQAAIAQTIQSNQFQENLQVIKDAAIFQDKQFEFDKKITEINAAAAAAEAGKKNIFERAGDSGTDIWKNIAGGLSSPGGGIKIGGFKF